MQFAKQCSYRNQYCQTKYLPIYCSDSLAAGIGQVVADPLHLPLLNGKVVKEDYIY